MVNWSDLNLAKLKSLDEDEWFRAEGPVKALVESTVKRNAPFLPDPEKDDLLIDIFTEFVAGIETAESTDDLPKFLRRISKFRSIDRLRAWQRKEGKNLALDSITCEPTADCDPTSDQEEVLDRCLSRLSIEDQKFLRLFLKNGRQATAAAFGISVQTASNRKALCIQRIRQKTILEEA